MAGRGGKGESETGTPSAPVNVEQSEEKKLRHGDDMLSACRGRGHVCMQNMWVDNRKDMQMIDK